MGKLILDISMSLDGFITGPNPSHDNSFGEGGERLHTWMGNNPPASGELDPTILNDSRFNKAIVRTVQYKNVLIMGALLMMLARRRQQAPTA